MIRKISLSIIYILYISSLFVALSLGFLQGTLFNNIFYTERILPHVYPTVTSTVADYVLQQSSFLSDHFTQRNIQEIVEESFSLADAKKTTDILFNAFVQRTLEYAPATMNIDLTTFKENFHTSLQAFLVHIVKQLPVCTHPEDASMFTCRMGDTSYEAVLTFINSYIDTKTVLNKVPDSITLTVPRVSFPAFFFRIDSMWYILVLYIPLILLLFIVAVSYKNIPSFFKKQGGIFLILGMIFGLIALLLNEIFSFVKFQLEQELGDNKKYVDLFYTTYSTMVKMDLLWTAAILFLVGMICVFLFFILRKDRKRK